MVNHELRRKALEIPKNSRQVPQNRSSCLPLFLLAPTAKNSIDVSLVHRDFCPTRAEISRAFFSFKKSSKEFCALCSLCVCRASCEAIGMPEIFSSTRIQSTARTMNLNLRIMDARRAATIPSSNYTQWNHQRRSAPASSSSTLDDKSTHSCLLVTSEKTLTTPIKLI